MTYQINTTDKRDIRALKLLQGARQWVKAEVKREDGKVVKAYGIPSDSDPRVKRLANQRQCSCPDFFYAQPILCSHIRAVILYVELVRAQQRKQELRRRFDATQRAIQTPVEAF